MIKVGINGFGRIGRFVFRAAQTRDDIEIVGINDLGPVDYLAYMLKYDTMHGRFDGTIEVDAKNSQLIVNGKKIRVTAEMDPANLKWDEVGAEYVVESTGRFLTMDLAENTWQQALNMLFSPLLPNRVKTAVRQTCSFAALTPTHTKARPSSPTHLARRTAWLLSLKSSTMLSASKTAS